MKRMQFSYALTLAFSAPVSRHTFLFRFAPPSDARQRLFGVETRCFPAVKLPQVTDAFGNRCALGHLEAPHQALDFRVSGEAELTGEPLAAPCPDFYRLPTPLTQADADILALGEGLAGEPLDVALRMAGRVHARIAYRQGVTDERTTAAQALALGEGVCQDMAHLLLAGLRARGLAARYVAGLLTGEGETHAWVEVYDGGRFVGVDPTHERLVDDTYLAVNAGRDSRDCAINRGVFAGFAAQSMTVHAKMDETSGAIGHERPSAAGPSEGKRSCATEQGEHPQAGAP